MIRNIVLGTCIVGLACTGCIMLRCPEPPKSQDGKPLPPQDDKSTVIQTGQRPEVRR